jgi:hypothetical protein
MRKEESGNPPKVKVGYGTTGATRGLHPRGLVEMRIWREAELEELDPKVHIIRIARQVGEKKRIGIVEKAKSRNFHIANPGKEEARPLAEAPTMEKDLPASIEGDITPPSESVEEAANAEADATQEAEESTEDSR